MRGGFLQIALALGMALTDAGCGFADVRSPVPEFMRAKETEPPPPEPPPDIRRLVHDNLEAVFVANSGAHDVRVSSPHHVARGTGWTACVRAEVNAANGKPMGTQTYRIIISSGAIIDRRHVEADDNCADESYEPI